MTKTIRRIEIHDSRPDPIKLIITGRNFDITDGLKLHIDKRLKKFLRHFRGILEIHIVLMAEKYRHTAEIRLTAKGLVLFVKEDTEDMYLSIDRVTEEMERRLRRHKEKLRRRHTKTEKNAEV